MCGIAGIVGPDARRHRERVRSMVAALAHRGPDDQHLVEFGSCVLGVARLAVIDPPGGRQPITSPDAALAVACNGEIYGYRRLRRELDYPFHTESDVEVVLALYRSFGYDGLLQRLPGTFALALWDDRRQQLLLARDRFGERPLYWAHGPQGELVFASELGGLLASGLVEPRLDRVSLAQVLRQGYVPPGRCIWENVSSLKPAHQLLWRRRARVSRYWDRPPVDPGLGWEEAVERFRAGLEHAVDDQLEADVPLGAFLSGGADSTTVAAIAARSRPHMPVFSFDVRRGVSEIEFARAVAERHHLDLHVMSDDDLDLRELLFQVSEAYDEPFGDSSSVLTWLICRFAREHVKVVITGDGADELLGGYLYWTRNLLDGAVTGDEGRSLTARALDRVRGSELAHRYATWRRYFTAWELAELGLPATDTEDVEWPRYRAGDLSDVLGFDVDGYLPGDILVKTDRASMAHGLEVRSPFLDVTLAELCLSMPDRLKVDGENEKLPLRAAFGHLWPDQVRGRPKMGFGVPLGPWLSDPGVRTLKDELLVDPRSPLYDLVDHEATQPWVDLDDQRTWNLLSVAIWWTQRRDRLGPAIGAASPAGLLTARSGGEAMGEGGSAGPAMKRPATSDRNGTQPGWRERWRHSEMGPVAHVWAIVIARSRYAAIISSQRAGRTYRYVRYWLRHWAKPAEARLRARLLRGRRRREMKRLTRLAHEHGDRRRRVAAPVPRHGRPAGWVFVVCGPKLHVETLAMALRELPRFSAVPPVVVTDGRRNEVPICPDGGVEIVDVATPDSLDDHQASIWLKTSLPRLLPRDRTWCYLDSDVVAIRPGVDEVFDGYVPPITFTLDLPLVVNNVDRFSPWAMTCDCSGEGAQASCDHLRRALLDRWGLDVPGDWVHWNGGVFLFDHRSDQFFEVWHRYALEAFDDPAFMTRDQHALIATVWSLGLQNHPMLSRRFNFIADPGNTGLSFSPERGWALAPDHEWLEPVFLHLYASRIEDPSWDLVRELQVPVMQAGWQRRGWR